MTLKSSVVVIQALKLLQPQWPQRPQQPQWPQWPQQPHSIKKITDPDDLIIPSTQMTNTSPVLWNGSSKIQFFTDIWYSSKRGCWGQPMSFFWKLVDKTQMCNPPEATRHHSQIKSLIPLPLRAIYFRTFQCEIPCKRNYQKVIRCSFLKINCIKKSKSTFLTLGSFKNYADMIFPFFDYLLTSTWTFLTLNVDKKKHFLTTYPPHRVQVVFERPLTRLKFF